MNRLLVLIIAGGFLFLLTDTIIEHREILAKEWTAYIPVLFSGIALAAAVTTVVRWNRASIKLFRIVLLASFLVAAGGMYFHLAEDDEDEKPAAAALQLQEKAGEEKERPPLAPLAFAGMAVIGLIGTSPKWKTEEL